MTVTPITQIEALTDRLQKAREIVGQVSPVLGLDAAQATVMEAEAMDLPLGDLGLDAAQEPVVEAEAMDLPLGDLGLDAAQEPVVEAEAMDLPLGFGRD